MAKYQESEMSVVDPKHIQDLKSLDDTTLGALFKEYITESEHNGWDGYDEADLPVLYSMFQDMLLYHETNVKT